MTNNLNRYFKQDDNIGVLSVTTGQLTIAKIPNMGAPDWIVPQSLVLAINPYNERIWTYIWQDQEVPVFHLVPKTQTPTHLVVLESVTDIHRVALQIQGEVTFHSVRIADLKDIDEHTYQQAAKSLRTADSQDLLIDESYTYQPVMLAGEVCMVPNLDKLSHFLVDLDS